MNQFIDKIRKNVRGVMASIAQILNEVSGGAISPNHVTIAGVVLHLIVLLAIINDQLIQAGFMLAIFGLLDTLDGELARLQGTESTQGAFLDAVADRIKEILVYAGLVVWIGQNNSYGAAAIALIALGGSMLVSYIKAKGEAEIRAHDPKISKKDLDGLLRTGLMQFEVRMAVLVFALLFGWIYTAVILLVVLAWWTAFDRLITINRYLRQ